MEKKQITISLRTVIDRQGEKEMSISKQKAIYLRKGTVEIIKYVENKEDIGEVNNYITIQPDRVSIKRSGHIAMNQIFEEGRKSETVYRHPYGTLHLQIETESITYQSLKDAKQGEIIIEYDAIINGIEEQRHHLILTYMEESEL